MRYIIFFSLYTYIYIYNYIYIHINCFLYLFDAAGGRSRWSKLLGEITADCRGTVRCTGLLAPRRRFRWNISRFDQARAGASYKSIELKDEFIMQNPSIDDLGVPPFQETSICGFLVDFPEQKQSNEGLTWFDNQHYTENLPY